MTEPYQELERRWAEFNDLDPRGMVACSSGTAALHLVLEAARLPAGSRVVVPDYTMVACARAVTMAGLRPAFVDCGPDLLIDPRGNGFRDALCAGASAAMAVHVYGRRCDMQAVTELAAARKAYVIEDLAEAHGIRPHPGTDAACWSFYRNKVVAGEEGGAVWFRDRRRADLARSLRSMGFTEAHDYTHIPRGHNYRMSNAHAGLILRSLAAHGVNLAHRRILEESYLGATPVRWAMPSRDVPWVYDMRIPGLTADRQRAAVTKLREAGCGARYGFKPLSSQEEYRAWVGSIGRVQQGASTPVTHAAAVEVIYLPLTPGEVGPDDPARFMSLLRADLHDLV